MTQTQFDKNDLFNIQRLFQSIELKKDNTLNISSLLCQSKLVLTTKETVRNHYIGSKQDIYTWIDIASKSYSFTMNHQFFYDISKKKYVDFILTYYNNVPVGTALLISNEHNLYVYMFSVLPEYKNNTIEENIIQEIVAFSKRENIPHIKTQSRFNISDIEKAFDKI